MFKPSRGFRQPWTAFVVPFARMLFALALCLCAGVPHLPGNACAVESSLSETSKANPAAVSQTAEERAWLRAHSVIRVVQDPGWPTIEFVDERGKPSGMADDYLKLIEDRLGIRFERVGTPTWQEAYARLKRWEIDFTTSVAATPERAGFWTFTRPYMEIPIVIAAKSDVTYIAGLKDLVGKKVAVVDGYAVSDWIPRDFPGVRLVKVGNAKEGLDLLQQGDVFAYVDNMLVVSYYLAKLKMMNVKIAGETSYVNAQSMAVRKDWPILAGILQKALDSISETEREEIYRKWMPIRYEHGFDYGLLWRALVVFAVILMGLVYWNRKLSREIGSRKAAEATLQASEAKYRLLVENANDGIFILQDGIIKFPNPVTERVTGCSAEELARVPFLDLVHPDDREVVGERVRRRLRGENVPGRYPFRFMNKAGEESWMQSSAAAITWEGRPAVLTVVSDITQQRKLESLLSTAQKMDSVGVLAGGIAHDFNNALTGIIGFSEMLKLRVANDTKALSDVEEVLRSADRAAMLTRQLLSFARRRAAEPVNLDLNRVVSDLEKLLRKVTRADVEIRTFLAGGLPSIRADRGQVEQVLMNLGLNARDAMPEGGLLSIETREEWLDAEYLKRHPFMKAGRYVVLSVSDTGVGMDEETLGRIFEPFFTTKDPDKGTGLGLVVVQGIVKQHDGLIDVRSEPGKGTTFRVCFPAIDAPAERKVSPPRGVVRGGSETILFADDDESVRQLAERMLTSRGYRVLVACDGEEAVDIVRRHGKDIAMVVLDMVMPRKGARQAYDEMIATVPALKFLFLSGYSRDTVHDSFVPHSGIPFLQKPFGPDALAGKVRELLDGS